MEKPVFIKVTVFADDQYRSKMQMNPMTNLSYPVSSTGSHEILVPLSAISHLSEGNPHNQASGYIVHIKSDYRFNLPFGIKSINNPTIPKDAIHLLK